MNHCYRLVFNKSTQVWQVVSEIAKSHSKSAAVVLLPLLGLFNQSYAWAEPAANALPTGGQVVSGQSAITQNGNQLNIVQGSQKSIINWQSYNIGSNAEVNYVQNNSSSISLNRVITGDPSAIFGKLNATGQVWLINPNGVLFGKGAQVNVGGLLASTLNIADDDFLSGKYQFTGSNGSVVNLGTITASQVGYVAMLAPEVRNEGVISAMQGTVAFAAGNAVTLDFNGNGLINVQVDSASVNTLVENKHLIKVGGGQVLMSTKAADGLITSVINNSGKIEANSMVNDGGVIRLTGAKTVINSGEISATSSSKKGGTVHLLGDNVGMFNSGSVNVSGKTGGGTILVGGDYQGKNTNIQNATKTFVGKDAKLIADATDSGDGGKVIVWADDITRYYGSTSAKGGAFSGNGGFVEISGKRLLNFLGNVDLSSANGVGGNLLLDPTNITITNALDTNTLGFTALANDDLTEAFADDASMNSVFDVTATTGSFAGVSAGSTITLQATNDITIASAFNVATATGSANNNLVLEANNNIDVNTALTLDGTGALTLRADADNNGSGNLAIGAAIATDIGGANLYGVNVTSTSAGSVNTTGASNANGGNVNIVATDSINLAGSITALGGTATTGNSGRNAGNINIAGINRTISGSITANGGAGVGANQAGGNAGVISITGVGTLSASTVDATTGAATGTGASGLAGGVNLTGTNITVGAITTTGQANGNGGTISATASGLLTLNGVVNSSGGIANTESTGKNAGAINLSANTIDTAATATITANGSDGLGTNQAGGNGAAITLTGAGNISTRAINASGGNGAGTLASGGNAGSIAITTSAGNITSNSQTLTARTGAGTGLNSVAGFVTLSNTSAAGLINTGGINTSGNINGGAGNVSATGNGALTLGAVSASGGIATGTRAGLNAGSVTISGAAIMIGAITASGGSGSGVSQAGGNGGAVSITGAGALNTAAITANGGNGTATMAKGGNAGSITLTTSIGNLTSTGALTVRTGVGTGTGAESTQGFVSVTNTSATGTVAVNAVDTRGQANGHGGNLTISGNAAVTVTNAIQASGGAVTGNRVGRNGGAVSITGGSVTTNTINTVATAGNGANQAGGNAGAVTVNALSSTVNVNNITATGGNGANTNGNGGNGGSVSLNAADGSTISIRNINTTGGNLAGTGTAGMGGNITLADNALLAADSLLTSTGGNTGVGVGGAINFSGTINSSGMARTLTIDSNGTATFAGTIGNTSALTNITTNATGSTVINGGSVTTTGAQTYNDALTLGAATTFTTTNSNVNFASSVNASGNNVAVAAGTGTFTATDAANDFGNLAVTAGSADVRDANAIVLGATNVTGAYTLQTAGNVTQTAAVIVGGAATFNAGATGDITLNTATNNFNSVAVSSARNVSLVDSNALTVNASTVTSIVARTLTGNLTLGGNIAASGTGDAITLASAANFLNPGNRTLSTPSGRWLIYANTHTGNTFGGLISGNQAIYGRSFPTATAETGNRYVFANSPSLSVTSTNQSKTYGQDAAATVANAFTATTFVDAAAFGGVFTQDTIANSLTGSATSTGSAATANAGSYAINVTPITSTNGYALTKSNAGNLTVNAAVVNIAGSRVYDGTTVFNAGAFSTFATGVNGETLNVIGSGGSVTSKNAGAAQTLTTGSLALANGSGLAINYTLTGGAHTGTITAATLNLNAVADSKVYDGNTSSLATVATSGLVGGDTVTGLTQSFASRNVLAPGGSTLNVDTGYTVNDGNSGNNYTVVTDTATGTITAATLNLNAVADSKVYDGNTSSLATVATSGLVGGDTVTGLSQSFASRNVSVPGGNTLSVDTGYTVNDGNSGNNYTVVTDTAAGTITAANLSITTNNATKTQGSVNPVFTSTISGFVGGDTSAVFAGILDYNTLADTTSPIGTYTVTPLGVTADNYFISFIDGMLEVTSPAPTDNNISTFNNATTRPEQAFQTCNSQSDGQAMINGLDEFGADDVDYQPSIGQPQVGGVIANGLAGASCSTL